MLLIGLTLSGLVITTPVVAQDAYTQHQLGVLEAQQQMDRYRGVVQQNELNALSAEVQTERALQDMRRQRQAPVLAPTTLWAAPAAGPDEVRIPDDRLADSNARIRAILERDKR
ncbi:MAG: hypothetical protein Q8R71_13505 [Phenylobacterium sp.]|nr:hypothetical protein [Phenylobacterium sp.]